MINDKTFEVALRNQMIRSMLREKTYTSAQIFEAVKARHPEWPGAKREKGFDAVNTRRLCLEDIQRMAIRMQRDGIDACYIKQAIKDEFRKSPITPETITRWFTHADNVSGLNHEQLTVIRTAIGTI